MFFYTVPHFSGSKGITCVCEQFSYENSRSNPLWKPGTAISLYIRQIEKMVKKSVSFDPCNQW